MKAALIGAPALIVLMVIEGSLTNSWDKAFVHYVIGNFLLVIGFVIAMTRAYDLPLRVKAAFIGGPALIVVMACEGQLTGSWDKAFVHYLLGNGLLAVGYAIAMMKAYTRQTIKG